MSSLLLLFHCSSVTSTICYTANRPSYAGLLWTVTPKLVWFLFVYAGVGTYVTTSAFGKRLMQLHFATVQREGDLRFDMVRTRENAGKITRSPSAVVMHGKTCTDALLDKGVRQHANILNELGVVFAPCPVALGNMCRVCIFLLP